MSHSTSLQRASLTVQIVLLLIMLLGLPLVGPLLTGQDLSSYLEFPPKTRAVDHAGFSWPVFLGLGLVLAAIVSPMLHRLVSTVKAGLPKDIGPTDRFPWWGWLGLGLGLADWVLAWTRFEWMQGWQHFTFTPLWIAFILVVNGLSLRRTGTCLLQRRPGFFLLLFPASAVFWWFFEYLNRFVQNWFYINVQDFSGPEYVLHASLSFATVLPAVVSLRELLHSWSIFQQAFGSFFRLKPSRPKLLAWCVLILSGAGLALIGARSDLLFPLLWVSPLLIIISVRTLFGQSHVLTDIASGDWSDVLASASAALICGFFWEMWNYFSLAKWVYSIPYVEAVHIFEMPLLGYAGYLPFGLECVVVAGLVEELCERASS
jgi:hypothetical protein